MRKLLAILLISLLSLQASWAVAASYCGHEQGAAARHFGHHEHRHPPRPAASAGVADAGQGHVLTDGNHGTDAMQAMNDTNHGDELAVSVAGADLDCSVCHAHALFGMPSVPTLAASDAPTPSRAALIQHPLPTVPQPRPERPNWRAA